MRTIRNGRTHSCTSIKRCIICSTGDVTHVALRWTGCLRVLPARKTKSSPDDLRLHPYD